MNQCPNHLPDKCGLHILCSHKNKTSTVQIMRITNIPNWCFEQVVFPGEMLLFEALPEAVLEIYISEEGRPILEDRFLCDRLRVKGTAYMNTKRLHLYVVTNHDRTNSP
ncbi:MAG: DUF1830 domain-containing protein [Cyanobacteria bacterium P01_G01_bin.19]